jgi:hypothetical protein
MQVRRPLAPLRRSPRSAGRPARLAKPRARLGQASLELGGSRGGDCAGEDLDCLVDGFA